jgi:hypothetical protein
MLRFEGLGWGFGLSLTQALPIIPKSNFKIYFSCNEPLWWAYHKQIFKLCAHSHITISKTHKIKLYTCYFFALTHLICYNSIDWAIFYGTHWEFNEEQFGNLWGSWWEHIGNFGTTKFDLVYQIPNINVYVEPNQTNKWNVFMNDVSIKLRKVWILGEILNVPTNKIFYIS